MYRGKLERTVVERIRTALWTMYGKEKIAARQWPEGKGTKWLKGEETETPAQPRTAKRSGGRSRE
jgi:hypothetical protein